MEKRSFRNVWIIGNMLVLAVIFIPILLILGTSKVLTLYDLDNPFETSDGVGLWLFVVVMTIATLWAFVSKAWKNWALEEVHPDDKEYLRYRIGNKDSIMIKGWNELSTLNRALRITGIVALAAASSYMEWHKGKQDRLFKEDGVVAWAEVIQVRKKYKKKKLNIVLEYTYNVDSVVYEDEKTISSGWVVSADQKLGFEAVKGDQFRMQYLASDPTQNRLQYEILGEETIERLVDLSIKKITPESEDLVMATCIAEQVNEQFGYKGICLILNREVSHLKNNRFNSFKYERMIATEKYGQLVKSCTPVKKPKPIKNQGLKEGV